MWQGRPSPDPALKITSKFKKPEMITQKRVEEPWPRRRRQEGRGSSFRRPLPASRCYFDRERGLTEDQAQAP